MFAWIAPLIAFILRGLGIGGAPKRQPDAEAQDDRAVAVDQAARAETVNAANTATQEAKDADRAKDDAAAAAVADGRADRVREPSSVRTSPDAHFRD